MGIHHAQLKNNTLQLLPCDKLDNVNIQVNDLHFDPKSANCSSVPSNGRHGLRHEHKTITQPEVSLKDVSISRIKPLNAKELLIATDGGGIYKMNVDTYQTVPFIVADTTATMA